jgi:cancer susceptibility candidate protein 1
MFQSIAVFIEPKDSSSVRLPRALGLTTNSLATVRAMQLTFDPCSVQCKPGEGQRFIALDCVLVLESLTLPERVKKTGEWGLRMELTTPPTIQRNEYPPVSKKGSDKPDLQPDELMMKVTFELPKTVAIRQNNLKIGKWNRTAKQWEHTAVATLTQESLRRFTFLTTDLTTLAVIQDKGHEVPYESWRITPIGDDEVLVHLLGRLHDDQHHTDTSAREVQIVVRDDMCKLVAPADAELGHLRGSWLPPPTLMRLLARAGYNFVLEDADGFTMPHVLTKSKPLEAKGYKDIALFASRFAVASSRHNKAGEDKDMALFRVSKKTRDPDDDETHFEPNPADEAQWHSVRYETSRCVLAQFREADDDAVLSAVEGHETHLNLYKCLAAELSEEEVNHIAKDSNALLQQGIFTLLSLVRPFSWG